MARLLYDWQHPAREIIRSEKHQGEGSKKSKKKKRK
jgi:hypothetical protein